MRLRTVVARLALASFVALANVSLANGISKWVDGDGIVHYGDQPPSWANSTQLKVRPNVIDTGAHEAPSLQSRLARPQRSVVLQQGFPHDDSELQARADLRAYVEHCRRNRGVDCEWEARAMLDGPATVLFPGDPYIFARPDIKPPPPGLPLKFQIPPTP